MARIAPRTEQDVDRLTRLAFRSARKRVGMVPDSFAVAAHHKTIMLGQGAYEVALERSSRVPARLKELAAIKGAAMVGCEFCLDIGSHLGREGGVTEAQLHALPHFESSEAFAPQEKLVLEYVVAMTRTPVVVGDELFARLREHFDEGQMVELTGLIAWENHRARFNHALGIGAQGFSEGAACARPEPAPDAVAA